MKKWFWFLGLYFGLCLLTACAAGSETPVSIPESPDSVTPAPSPDSAEPAEDSLEGRAALYLRVLEDLWEVDKGLNESGVEMIGVDLSKTSLSPAEQSAVARAFAGNHDAEPIQATWDELLAGGYMTAEPISPTGSGTDLTEPEHYFYEWKNGCFFSITEQPVEGAHSLVPVTFDAWKWRSSLGAYFFSDCTALQGSTGEWSGYQIGSEMIS